MSKTALLVVDMLHPYSFEDADQVAENAQDVLPVIADTIAAAREADVLMVYVNDNYGAWNSSREELLDEALDGNHPELIEPIKFEHEDAFVWKARHSTFYETALDYLLRSEGIERIVLTGQVTEQCIVYSALDAYIRHYELVVPRDAVVPLIRDLADASMEMMRRNMKASTPAAWELDL
jgi:nicotinamidase-related amidase